ncbi:GNAT family N-acetyltransferase [Actinomadura scrupuli]|uniref:GNAT family N-acetyltransferase n=1 Tax=Actinomadura scrupuli TaxID=559629 RepID=UPI003D993B84
MTELDTLLTAYDEQMRGAPPVPAAGTRHEHDGPLLRIVGQHRGFVSGPRDLGVRGTDLDRLITRQRDYFAARGEAVEWKTRGHDRPADLPERLLRAGFVPEERETVVIGLAARLATDQADPPGVVIRQVATDLDLRRIADLQTAIWGQDMGWLADDLIARVAAAPGDITVLAAEADGELVSAAWLVLRPGTDFAGLWGGSTLPAWRGKGIYRALIAHRARRAAALGVTYLQVDASADSEPILRRLGFQAVTTTTPYVWSPAG